MLRLAFATIVIALGVSAPARPTSAAAQLPKERQTPAQTKIDSHLLRAIDRARSGAAPLHEPLVRIDAKGRALVELRADVTAGVERQLRRAHATTVSVLPEYRSILAWVPLTQLEALAARDDVYAIQPAPQATTNKPKENGR